MNITDFRKHKPETKGSIEFSLPSIEEYKLDNGIRVLYVQKTSLPITQFEIVVECGSSGDPTGQDGLAYLTAMLLDEGAGGYDSLKLSDEIDKIGSVLSISSDKDSLYTSMLCMNEYIERSVELLALILSDPNFNPDDFEREKSKLLTKIIQTQDNPSQVANNIFDKILYENSCYSHPVIGSENSVSTLSNNNIIEYYNNVLKRRNTTVVAVGSETGNRVVSLLNKHLSNYSYSPIENQNVVEYDKLNPTKIYLINSENANQSEIRVGHLTSPRNNGDYFQKLLMNAILGGQFSSRINLNLREDKGFTYGANSYFNYNKLAGTFTVSTAVQSEVTTEAVLEIMKELKGIGDGASDKELQFAKSFLVKRFPAMFETYMQVANNLGTIVLYELEKDYFNTYLDNLQQVELNEIRDAANKYIHPDRSVILVNGNAKDLRPKLEDKFEYEITSLDKEGNIL